MSDHEIYYAEVVEGQPRFHNVEIPVAVAISEENNQEEGIVLTNQFGSLRGRNADAISPLLFDLIREGTTCISDLSFSLQRDSCCQKIVAQCDEAADQAFYVQDGTGRTPLHEACLRNVCMHVINALLNANPFSALERDNFGNCPLHLVFVNFNNRLITAEQTEELIHALLQMNPNHLATAVNGDGATPLHMACLAPETMMNNAVLSRLLKSNPMCAETSNNRRQTPLHVYCARKNADREGAEILLDPGRKILHQGDLEGRTPLHVAALHLNTDLICFFLSEAPEVILLRDNNGRTALHTLCSQDLGEDQLPAIRYLIHKDPEVLTMIDAIHEQNPLHIACARHRPFSPAIRLLATTTAASMRDIANFTALHHACEASAGVEIIKMLLSVHKMAAAAVTKKQNTALHTACEQNACHETVKLLIGANKDALKLANDYGFTPLHCVCRAYEPQMRIIKALLDACPSSVMQRTNGGETAIHLACSSGAFVSVLELLTLTQKETSMERLNLSARPEDSIAEYTTNKIGNSPLHEACFRGASFEHIETLAKATPEWIMLRNNAGYTPLQIMCKSGCLDERVVIAFSRIRGPEVFSVVDPTGHTPLHSACREGTSLAAIRSLIQAFPDALHLKTSYGDTPLHLSCLRGSTAEIVNEIALSSSDAFRYNLLEPNAAGQTPIGIAMEDFNTVCIRGQSASRHDCCFITSNYTSSQLQSFYVLSALVKLLYFGGSIYDNATTGLVKACICLHQQGVRLDPAFIHRSIISYPEEVRLINADGNYPLHIEASIPFAKIDLLDGSKRCSEGSCYSRSGILGILLSVYPAATKIQNALGEFPISLMIQNGRPWDQTFGMALQYFPPALHWYKFTNDKFTPHILSKVSKECGIGTLYQLIRSKPDMIRK